MIVCLLAGPNRSYHITEYKPGRIEMAQNTVAAINANLYEL
jgi:hypothetical protein